LIRCDDRSSSGRWWRWVTRPRPSLGSLGRPLKTTGSRALEKTRKQTSQFRRLLISAHVSQFLKVVKQLPLKLTLSLADSRRQSLNRGLVRVGREHFVQHIQAGFVYLVPQGNRSPEMLVANLLKLPGLLIGEMQLLFHDALTTRPSSRTSWRSQGRSSQPE